jgi:hypothetical protein
MPIPEEFQTALHLFGRKGCDQLEETSHLLSDGVLLLHGNNDPCVRLMAGHVIRMESTEVASVETVQDAVL